MRSTVSRVLVNGVVWNLGPELKMLGANMREQELPLQEVRFEEEPHQHRRQELQAARRRTTYQYQYGERGVIRTPRTLRASRPVRGGLAFYSRGADFSTSGAILALGGRIGLRSSHARGDIGLWRGGVRHPADRLQ